MSSSSQDPFGVQGFRSQLKQFRQELGDLNHRLDQLETSFEHRVQSSPLPPLVDLSPSAAPMATTEVTGGPSILPPDMPSAEPFLVPRSNLDELHKIVNPTARVEEFIAKQHRSEAVSSAG